jgi:carboxylesterase
MLAAIVAGAALVGAAWWRGRQLRTMNALTLRHRTLGADGIVNGGESFELARRGAPAVLLLHGAGDTPQSMRYLGDALFARGFHVFAPLLPRHGRTLGEFQRVTADELTHAAEQSYVDLRRSHEWVGVIGLSMGGALAVQLAAEYREIPALGLIAPYLAMPRQIERLAKLSHIWGMLIPAARSGEGVSILDPDERRRNLAYGVFTAAGLRALRVTMRRAVFALPRVAAPTLVIQSSQDNRIAAPDTERAFALIGSNDKRLEWVTGAAHIITVDYGREEVIARLAAFMESHLAPRAPTPSARGISS